MRSTPVLMLVTVLVASGSLRAQCDVTELQKIVPDDASDNDGIGHSVAVSNSLVAFGAWQDDILLWEDMGSVYVYKYDGTSLIFDQWLLPPDPMPGMWYGVSVAMHNDLLVVGAPRISSGTVYVYRHNGDSYELETLLKASDGASGDFFGDRVAVHDERILVGACLDDDQGADSGSAYVFHFDGTNWVQEAKLLAEYGYADCRFGSEVALHGLLALVSAPFRSSCSGRAYVFRRDGDEWPQEAMLRPWDSAPYEYFGTGVAIENDATYGDVAVVGSSHDDELADDAGAAYVFRLIGDEWDETQKIMAPGGDRFEYFGCSVATYEDRLAVGAFQHPDIGGSTFLYQDDGTDYNLVRRHIGGDDPPGGHLGNAVAISNNVTVSGAECDDEGGAFAGAVFIHSALPKIQLLRSKEKVYPGDFLWFQTYFGNPGDAVGLFLVDASGIPMFRLLAYGQFGDPSFKWYTGGFVPDGLAGLIATFQAVGSGLCGDIVDSNTVYVEFM
ncbi:MAG: hypothetical protein AB1486_12100 [Planctomycetota bacterium]